MCACVPVRREMTGDRGEKASGTVREVDKEGRRRGTAQGEGDRRRTRGQGEKEGRVGEQGTAGGRGVEYGVEKFDEQGQMIRAGQHQVFV